MSTPCLHSASVPTREPSRSTIASRKKSAGCWDQTRSRAVLMASIKVRTSGSLKPPAEVTLGGGVGDALGAEGIEIDGIVAPQLDMFEAAATGEDIESNVQNMVGFVIGEVAFEEMEIEVDAGDQAGGPCQHHHGADAAGGEALDALAEFVVDVGGGDHGAVAFGAGAILDAVEDSPPAFPQELANLCRGLLTAVASWDLLRDDNHHSKPSVAWKNEDPLLPALFQDLRGFSSFS